MRTLFFFLVLFSLPAEAGVVRNKIADACSRLTDRDPELTKNCVNHAELFEVDSQYIRAVVDFHPSVEIRMKALKSGASVDTLNLCKSLGWSIDNTLSCMRSYPTPSLVKECKKISPKEDEQLKCVRIGRETSQVQACGSLGERVEERFQCLSLDIATLDTINCRNTQQGFSARLRCLQKIVQAREEEYARDQAAMQARYVALKNDPAYGDPSLAPSAPRRRSPASIATK